LFYSFRWAFIGENKIYDEDVAESNFNRFNQLRWRTLSQLSPVGMPGTGYGLRGSTLPGSDLLFPGLTSEVSMDDMYDSPSSIFFVLFPKLRPCGEVVGKCGS
jgi:hypothetical protein